MSSASILPVPISITEEPKREEGRLKRAKSVISGPDIEESPKLRGLSSLAVANVIHIKVDKKWWKCDWSMRYRISDAETDTLIFSAIESYSFCSFCSRSLQNIVILDLGKMPIARICYKEKYCSRKLVMAVYAPADLLVGTVEESTGFIGSTEFIVRNSDGHHIFSVEYKHGSCPLGSWCCCGWKTCIRGSYFKIKSYKAKAEIGKILEKTSEGLRLQFKTKLDITGKIILTAFCVGLIHKSYNQTAAESEGSDSKP